MNKNFIKVSIASFKQIFRHLSHLKNWAEAADFSGMVRNCMHAYVFMPECTCLGKHMSTYVRDAYKSPCTGSGVTRGVGARGQGILAAPPKDFVVVQKTNDLQNISKYLPVSSFCAPFSPAPGGGRTPLLPLVTPLIRARPSTSGQGASAESEATGCFRHSG